MSDWWHPEPEAGPPVILNFPLFVIDFDYLWKQIGSVIGSRSTRTDAEAAWRAVVDLDKVRVDSAKHLEPKMSLRELEALVEELRRQNSELAIAYAQAIAEEAQAGPDCENGVLVEPETSGNAARSWRRLLTRRKSLTDDRCRTAHD